MTEVVNIIILLLFLLEVIILSIVEKVLWKTYYTPLNFLMIPYTIVLLVNISLPASMDFVPFYYPSILVWMIGLLIFAIPSIIMGLLYQKNSVNETIKFSPPQNYNLIYFFGVILLIASLFYLMTRAQVSEDLIGSEEFAESSFVGGIWGHVREALLAILILSIFMLERKRVLLFLMVIGIIFIAFVYQVQSWIIIPIFAGFLMRLITGKSQFKFKYLIYLALGGSAIFFLTYFTILVFAVEDGEFSFEIMELIYNHFLFYLLSGTATLGIDMQWGFIETPCPECIFAPFINIYATLTGGDLVSPINPIFIDIGWAGANVRTFFGTLLINLGLIGSILYVLVLSLLIYNLLYWYKIKPNLWVLSVYALMCGLLFMGWFEFYFFHLTVIEIPVILLFFIGVMHLKPVVAPFVGSHLKDDGAKSDSDIIVNKKNE